LDAAIVWYGFLGSLCAGMMTAVGAAGVIFLNRLSAKLEDALLSAAAGIMLAATFFSLILPAIEFGEQLFDSTMASVTVVACGLVVGAIVLHLAHRCAPHEHFLAGREGPDAKTLSRIWLFIIAITIHNFPEGMAVGVGFAGDDIANGSTLALGIGIQNVPEGLAVAVALLAARYSRMTAFLVGVATGLVEPIGGLVGAVAVAATPPAMPLALGFAAGAMLYVISDEIIPETHRRGFETLATFSLLGGFVLMMFLDATLG